MYRVVLSIAVLFVVTLAFPAAADDRSVCLDPVSPPDTAIATCTRLISGGKLQDRDLATAYYRRGYFHLKKGESDRALADLSEAIRIDQRRGISAFLLANWAIIIGAIGAAVGWYLTYRGWAVARKTSFDLENEKYQNIIALEKEKYQNAIDLERRKAKLGFVSDQIRYLYGPLLALCKTRRSAFNALMERYGLEPDGKTERAGYFDDTERTPEELRQWRLWRAEVLMPIVARMQEAILQNAHLIEGGKMPESFLLLMAHAASYKAVMKNWSEIIERKEMDEATGLPKIDAQQQTNGKYRPLIPHTANENFPEEKLLADIKPTLERLGAVQAKLIESVQT